MWKLLNCTGRAIFNPVINPLIAGLRDRCVETGYIRKAGGSVKCKRRTIMRIVTAVVGSFVSRDGAIKTVSYLTINILFILKFEFI